MAGPGQGDDLEQWMASGRQAAPPPPPAGVAASPPTGGPPKGGGLFNQLLLGGGAQGSDPTQGGFGAGQTGIAKGALFPTHNWQASVTATGMSLAAGVLGALGRRIWGERTWTPDRRIPAVESRLNVLYERHARGERVNGTQAALMEREVKALQALADRPAQLHDELAATYQTEADGVDVNTRAVFALEREYFRWAAGENIRDAVGPFPWLAPLGWLTAIGMVIVAGMVVLLAAWNLLLDLPAELTITVILVGLFTLIVVRKRAQHKWKKGLPTRFGAWEYSISNWRNDVADGAYARWQDRRAKAQEAGR